MINPLENPGYVDLTTLQCLDEFVMAFKQRLLEILRIGSRDCVLDVGCGLGTDTIVTAQLVGRQGFVVGIDYDQTMVDQANKRARMAGVADWTVHIAANAAALPFKANAFDICHSERLFQHVDNGSHVLAEMVRVTRVGGKLAVADTDWCTLSIDTPEIEIERRVIRGIAGLVRNGYAGRQLFRLFKEQHLADVQVEAYPIIWTDWNTFRATSFSIANLDKKLIESGVVTEEELQQFMASLENAHRRGVFFANGNIMLVTGNKLISEKGKYDG